mmetsp:Transcript_8012/g.19679  ORF Transcript_8012/g.19679 Transcript_8012/m.19679 type:complete len:342 (-) Transcript_8012:1015-2040(-)
MPPSLHRTLKPKMWHPIRPDSLSNNSNSNSSSSSPSLAALPPIFCIQKGATDLKRALAEAQKGGRLLVVAWVQPEQRQQQQQQQQEQQEQPHPGAAIPQGPLLSALAQSVASAGTDVCACVLLAAADVAGSAANAGLAGALKVAAPFPCLHVYQGMRVVRCIKANAATQASRTGPLAASSALLEPEDESARLQALAAKLKAALTELLTAQKGLAAASASASATAAAAAAAVVLAPPQQRLLDLKARADQLMLQASSKGKVTSCLALGGQPASHSRQPSHKHGHCLFRNQSSPCRHSGSSSQHQQCCLSQVLQSWWSSPTARPNQHRPPPPSLSTIRLPGSP